MPEKMARAVELVRSVHAVVKELEQLFPGRRFTPDGHMVGSLGEVWAAYLFGLELLAKSTEVHDARAPGGGMVQVKATQVRSVGLSSVSDHLVVLRLNRDGMPSVVFNGPGEVAWQAAGRMQKNGQRQISLTKLASLMADVPADRRLRQLR